MLFTEEHYGKTISEALSAYLKRFTSTNDLATAASRTSVSPSTAKGVVYRQNSLTEHNSKAIIELMKIAVENRKNNVEYENTLIKEVEQETGLTL